MPKNDLSTPRAPLLLRTAALFCVAVVSHAHAQRFIPIEPVQTNRTVTLTGHDLTLEQLIAIARDGAKVQWSPEANQRASEGYGLLLEAGAENVPVYWFNRGAGSQRETHVFDGDPTTPENTVKIKQRLVGYFAKGADASFGPEIEKEEDVRAILAVRANTVIFDGPSPQLGQCLLDMLNRRIAPVLHRNGGVSEGDLTEMRGIAAAMVGKGYAYYAGSRMPAADALRKAGMQPLEPFGADDAALTSTNAFTTAQAALLTADAMQMLQWADLISAMDMLGMNSSVSPLGSPVQKNRPFKAVNQDASTILSLLRGSYLLQDDPQRIIQDPESLRASSQRQGSAWQAWAQLKYDVVLSMNSSDHNPAISIDVSPDDSWELNTPQFLRYYVKGGALSHGKHGYILSNANWDPYPLSNDLEAFTIALANMDICIVERLDRFRNKFFTGISAADLLSPAQLTQLPPSNFSMGAVDIFQAIEVLANPIPPSGFALVSTVEDLEGQTKLKVRRSDLAVQLTMQLLSLELLNATYWIDLRRIEVPARSFGETPTATWVAFRKVVPWQQDSAAPPVTGQDRSVPDVALAFIKTHSASEFSSSTQH